LLKDLLFRAFLDILGVVSFFYFFTLINENTKNKKNAGKNFLSLFPSEELFFFNVENVEKAVAGGYYDFGFGRGLIFMDFYATKG
jgi:hypothetical protein